MKTRPSSAQREKAARPPVAIPVSKFKATCLAIIDRVSRTGEPVVVTKRGVPVAQLVPPPPPAPAQGSRFGCLAHTVSKLGDLVTPLPEKEWEVLR